MNELHRDAMIRTVYGEARSEGIIGQAAVAHVILNRAKNPAWWGKDGWSVCHAPYQFSCWNKTDPNLHVISNLKIDGKQYADIARVVDDVLAGKIEDPTGGATHYKHRSISASWDSAVADKTPVRIGAHLFYKLGPSA